MANYVSQDTNNIEGFELLTEAPHFELEGLVFTERLRTEAYIDIHSTDTEHPTKGSLAELRTLHKQGGSSQAQVLRGMVATGIVAEVEDNRVLNAIDFIPAWLAADKEGDVLIKQDIQATLGDKDTFLAIGKYYVRKWRNHPLIARKIKYLALGVPVAMNSIYQVMP